MKVSLKWLQKYFEQPLPDAEAIADALTFHAFEIEEASGDMLDVKILPNRAADCLCHRGIAIELSAILNLPIKNDPLREAPKDHKVTSCDELTINVEDSEKCQRYIGAIMKGVKIGPSPKWLKESLESVGQRSINNVVDATNYVMLNIGQPLHAFDAGKLVQKNGGYAIGVRAAKEGEKITTLSGDDYILNPGVLTITDANADKAIGIAGVKGGKLAEISQETTDIVIESANFDGTRVRRAAQALKLFTDASQRFQNNPSPELAAYGMRDVIDLIKEVAGGEVKCVVDLYLEQPHAAQVSVSLARINGLLGYDFSLEGVTDVFRRLGLPATVNNEQQSFVIVPPFERTDLTIPENLIEEVGRIIGYDKIPALDPPPLGCAPDQARFRGIERIKDFLIDRGFIEISTQSFAVDGDIELVNPLDKAKPMLRKNLDENMRDAFSRAKYSASLVLAPNEEPKLFEIGTVFAKNGEELAIKTSKPVQDMPKIQDDENYEPRLCNLGAYTQFSVYPFVVRDIAFWANDGFTKSIITKNAGPLLVRVDQFDKFEKEGRISYAFRLVFQSFERTLTDEEVNDTMEKVAAALRAAGCEVR